MRVLVGHYSAGFAAKAAAREVPLWVLFLAAQLVDVLWALLVLAGIERVELVPGITASNPLDLQHIPYTHSLVAVVAWSALAVLAFRLLGASRSSRSTRATRAALIVGAVVLSHWLLDWITHRPDLPLAPGLDASKVGLGLWNHAAAAYLVEAALVVAGAALCLGARPLATPGGRALVGLALGLLLLQAVAALGPAPTSPTALALTALLTYGAFTAAAAWADRRGA